MHGFGHAAGYGQGFGGFGEGQRPVEEVVNNYYGDGQYGGEHGGHPVSAGERAIGEQEDRDFGSLDSKSDSDSSHGSGEDAGSGSDDGGSNFDDSGSNLDSGSSLDDSSFDDGGSGFDDSSFGDGGGGDDGNFA
jgi:hypothetical protein